MKIFTVTVSQNGGEYYRNVFIKGIKLERINHNTIIVDGIEIQFDMEYITEIDRGY